jgi:AcrR family transcriptional regulator
VRTHGWNGDPPASDEEAVARILAATRSVIDRHADEVSMAAVAKHLRVSRQTIYRYFPSTDHLVGATALQATGGFVNRLAAHIAGFDKPGPAIVEALAFTLERLPEDPYLGILLEPTRAGPFARRITSEMAMDFGRSILERLDFDWSAAGYDDRMLDELIEHLLRTIQSFVIDPGRPPRAGQDLRRYLNRWVAPPSKLPQGS